MTLAQTIRRVPYGSIAPGELLPSELDPNNPDNPDKLIDEVTDPLLEEAHQLSPDRLLAEVQGTPLKRLICECEEAERDPRIIKCSDELVADYLLLIMKSVLQTGIPTGISTEKEALLSEPNLNSFNGDLATANRFLALANEVYLRYSTSPILKSLGERIKAVLDFCLDYPTVYYESEGLTHVQVLELKVQRLERMLATKEITGTPMCQLDMIEILQLGLQMLQLREGILLTPLVKIIGYGIGIKGIVVLNDKASFASCGDATDYLEIQGVLNAMVSNLDDSSPRIRRPKIVRIIQMLTLLAILLSSCANIPGGDNNPGSTKVAGGNDYNPNDSGVSFTATSTLTQTQTPPPPPTLTPTLTPPPTLTPTLTPTPETCLTNEGVAIDPSRPTAEYLVQLLDGMYDHTPTDKLTIDVNASLGDKGNVEFVAELQKLLALTADGIVPDLCALAPVVSDTPIVLDNYTQKGENPPVFNGGILVITKEFLQELERAGLSIYIVMYEIPPYVTTRKGDEIIPFALAVNVDTTGFYDKHRDPDEPDTKFRDRNLVFPNDIRSLEVALGNVQFMAIGPKGMNLESLHEKWPASDELYTGPINQLIPDDKE